MNYNIDRVLGEINVGINYVTQRVGFDDGKLRIAIPKYFIGLLNDNFKNTVSYKSEEKVTNKVFLFGIEVVLNYENKIVIFHEDMPILKDVLYVTVDLN